MKTPLRSEMLRGADFIVGAVVPGVAMQFGQYSTTEPCLGTAGLCTKAWSLKELCKSAMIRQGVALNARLVHCDVHSVTRAATTGKTVKKLLKNVREGGRVRMQLLWRTIGS